MKTRQIKLWFAKIKYKIKTFKEYYGWYFPSMNVLLAKKKQLIELRSAMFREDNKVRYAYYKGQIELIDSLLEEWHGKRNEKSKG
jgi:RNA processing factor Prp31